MFRIRKELLHILTSCCIILSVFLLGLLAVYGIVFNALSKATNSNTLYTNIRNLWCNQVISEKKLQKEDKIVVLRLDDVQAFSWSKISMKMIRDAYSYDAPIVAGVIPSALSEDRELSNFLHREYCNIEIAIHGWDHSGGPSDYTSVGYITEFGNIDADEALLRLKKSQKALEKYTHGKAPITFIPPFNLISNAARSALLYNGIQVISAIGTGAYDYHTTTYNFDKKRIVPVKTIVNECESSFEKGSICVIMMHPQDYANKENELDMGLYKNYYLHLLEELKNSGVKFATFRDLIHNGM